jgi:uncharacterized protein
LSRRKPPKGGARAAPSSRSPASRRRKGRSGRGWLLLVAALALFALGALFGERILQRLSAWRPAPAAKSAPESKAAPKLPSKPKPARPRPAPTAESGRPSEAPSPTGAPAPEASPATGGDPSTGAEAAQPRARIALVIDDLGRDVAAVERLTSIAPGVQLSYAVLPFESRTGEVVEALRRHGAELLLHLPMVAEGGADAGPGALTARMSRRELAAATVAALAAVPGASGVNNHMGSKLSGDRAAMTAILGEVRRERRYFLDSRTTKESVGFEVARELGIPAASRDLFLDDDPERSAVAAQFQLLLETARERGAAIAIAHPRPATLAVLAEAIPRAVAEGFEFVPVSYLLERSEEFPE